ncbi:hypothetical protein NA57DRAFT_82166 [Rhizodiscina lignyota]|uniref:Uncharacterized protein n=1 Tax=Rhizodiscina lignyota TaxID=1504668 RepID=A0A9P4I340_9PEZI|nr:hypothetical protein NA57DRAFT_82166 [Rhizodiscina lignyota]
MASSSASNPSNAPPRPESDVDNHTSSTHAFGALDTGALGVEWWEWKIKDYNSLETTHPDPNYHTYHMNLLRESLGLPLKPDHFYDPFGDPEELERIYEYADNPGASPPGDIQTEPRTGNGIGPRMSRMPPSGKIMWAYEKYADPANGDLDELRQPKLVYVDEEGEEWEEESEDEEEEEDDGFLGEELDGIGLEVTDDEAYETLDEECEEDSTSDEYESESSEDKKPQKKKRRTTHSPANFSQTRRAVVGSTRAVAGSTRAALARAPLSSSAVPSNPQAQSGNAHLLTTDILTPQEYQNRINQGDTPEATEVLAGLGEFWLPVESPDEEPGPVDLVADFGLRADELRAITNRPYPFPHKRSVIQDRTLYISGLDQVTEDNLPPFMADIVVDKVQAPYLRDSHGNYLKSVRTGQCFRNFGNLVPNGISSVDAGAFFALFEHLGATFTSDIMSRVNLTVYLGGSPVNKWRNKAERWRCSYGGLGPNLKSKGKKPSEKANGTMDRLKDNAARTLHRVAWDVHPDGRHMRQPRPAKMQNMAASNYQGLWYDVPPAREVDGVLLTVTKNTTKYLPKLSSYLQAHPNARVLGGARAAAAAAAAAAVSEPDDAEMAEDEDETEEDLGEEGTDEEGEVIDEAEEGPGEQSVYGL